MMFARAIIACCVITSVAYAGNPDASKTNKISDKDIVEKASKTDLLTSPKTNKPAEPPKKTDKSIKKDKPATAVEQPQIRKKDKNPEHPGMEEPLKPSTNYMDVYVGKCPFSINAIKAAREFSTQKNLFTQFFGMKTSNTADISMPKELTEIGVYLPINAEKYGINNVPAYVLNINGSVYKVEGDVDLNEIFDEIVKGGAQGEKKKEYTDMGTRGKVCKTISINLGPHELTKEEKAALAKEYNPPDFREKLRQFKNTLPESSQPQVISKTSEVSRHTGVNKFIVFSDSQRVWANNMLSKGAVGCCTDCSAIGRFAGIVQLCSKEILSEMGVNSTPAVVNFQ